LARLLGLAQIAARVDKQIRLARLTGIAGLTTRSRKKEVPVVLVTRKAGLWRIQLTWRVGLWRIRLTQKTELCKTWRARNQKKENVLLQAKG
jgi:hypothetical protein